LQDDDNDDELANDIRLMKKLKKRKVDWLFFWSQYCCYVDVITANGGHISVGIYVI